MVYCHCAKDQIKNRTPKMLILRFKFIPYGYFDSCLMVKTPITENSNIYIYVYVRIYNSQLV